MNVYVLLMLVNLLGLGGVDKAWVPAPVLGNPFDRISECGRVMARMETASGGVAEYKCKPIKRRDFGYGEMGSSPG